MRIDIVNVRTLLPKCIICDGSTDQMMRINHIPNFPHICMPCANEIYEVMKLYKDDDSQYF